MPVIRTGTCSVRGLARRIWRKVWAFEERAGHVEEHQIGRAQDADLQRPRAVLDGRDRVAALAQRRRQEARGVGVGIGDEDVAAGHARSSIGLQVVGLLQPGDEVVHQRAIAGVKGDGLALAAGVGVGRATRRGNSRNSSCSARGDERGSGAHGGRRCVTAAWSTGDGPRRASRQTRAPSSGGQELQEAAHSGAASRRAHVEQAAGARLARQLAAESRAGRGELVLGERPAVAGGPRPSLDRRPRRASHPWGPAGRAARAATARSRARRGAGVAGGCGAPPRHGSRHLRGARRSRCPSRGKVAPPAVTHQRGSRSAAAPRGRARRPRRAARTSSPRSDRSREAST